jgi:hypothetical protein
VPIRGPLIQSVEIAENLGETNFKVSNGWLETFRISHNSVNKAVCAEKTVDVNIVDHWNSKLVEMWEGFFSKNIFNVGETDFFFYV